MPKVKSEKRNAADSENDPKKAQSGWNNGKLFGTETTETTFQGAGFKDKQKALETIKLLEGRDIAYQYNIINSMYNRAKVILKRTNDKEKIQNLSEAIDTFAAWIDDYKTNNRSKENLGYLPLETVEKFEKLAKKYDIKSNGFLKVYRAAEGDYKKLRACKVEGKEVTWDVHRNNALKALDKENRQDLWEEKGLPSKIHTQRIMWGYSNEPSKVKKAIPLLENL
ncbi:uncharacterized protein Ude [Bemisia tabaci]|uniref:uncharacterized protein Ude n=1 Tax=Bemisia tabaci TaxID=7038 RepID=UPI003B27FB14